jgi:hypothetical protein
MSQYNPSLFRRSAIVASAIGTMRDRACPGFILKKAKVFAWDHVQFIVFFA